LEASFKDTQIMKMSLIRSFLDAELLGFKECSTSFDDSRVMVEEIHLFI